MIPSPSPHPSRRVTMHKPCVPGPQAFLDALSLKRASSYCGRKLIDNGSCGLADIRNVLRLNETLHGILAVKGLTSALVPGVNEGIRTTQASLEQSRTCWKLQVIFHNKTITLFSRNVNAIKKTTPEFIARHRAVLDPSRPHNFLVI